MSNVTDPSNVDFVAVGADDRLTLVIIEPRPWGSDAEQPEQLREKLNSYVAWIDSGACVAQYPAATKGIDILVQCVDEPSGENADLLLTARNGLADRGIGLFYRAAVDDVTAPTTGSS